MKTLLLLFALCALTPDALAQTIGMPDAAATEETGDVADPEEAVTAPLPIEADAGPAAPAKASDPVKDTEADPVGAVGKIFAAVKEGNWRMVAALVLSLCMLMFAKARQNWKLFAGKRGGAVAVMLLSLVGGFATSLAAGAPIDWGLIIAVVGTAWTAVGGYTWLRDLFSKAPAEDGPGE